MAAIGEFVVKDPIEIRDDILRTIKNGLIQQGVSEPQVGPNSDWFIIATALGNELAVVGASAVVKADQQMPDTAVGDDLKRIAALFDLAKQPAAGSIGFIVIESSATSPIETGRQFNDAAGLTYEVTVGGNYANGASVPIRAISTGFDTNHAAGDTLRWGTPPPFCSDQVTVGVGGLVNGIDAEDDEALRARVYAVLQNPPGAGDAEHCAEIAEASTASVQKAFIYPAVQGPSTVHIAVAAAPTTTNKSRVIASATMNGTVEPYTKGKLPTHAHVVVTTVADVNVDLAIALSLPEAPTANPPGPGGGWSNGTPWPAPDGSSYTAAAVVGTATPTSFGVSTGTAPTPNVTRIAWLSPYDWKLYTALVTGYVFDGTTYTITIDKAFTGIASGSYIWPECANAQAYVDALLASFALMGPGEKTTNVSALARGFRHPPPSSAWTSSVGGTLLRAVSNAGDEVLATQYLSRYDGTTTIYGSAGSMTPQVPGGVSNAPNIYVPRHCAFYRAQ